MGNKKSLSSAQKKEILETLRARFDKNMNRHKGISWDDVEQKLESVPSKLWSLFEMERTGGEPDVVAFDKKEKCFLFMDCAAESPKERRSLCYDSQALESRKEHKPSGSAMDAAAAMETEILDEVQYRYLQSLGKFDAKTSSWLKTPADIRKLGGAVFGDYRYGQVFIYHNGAESYYSSRGFRTMLKVK